MAIVEVVRLAFIKVLVVFADIKNAIPLDAERLVNLKVKTN